MLDQMILFLDVTGTFVFAISGALTASDKKLDLLGASVIAFVTALGGGTLRDILLGQHPLGWMRDPWYILVIGMGVAAVFFFKQPLLRAKRALSLFDTLGIGLFTVLGAQKALYLGLDPSVAIIMGTISASFGGVIRDILCNEIPLIFRSGELYATTCIAGGIVFVSLRGIVPVEAALVVGALVVIALRVASRLFHLTLPRI